jgi:cyclase
MAGLTKRIIACLDVKDGRTVKGIRFEGLVDSGDPVELATRYAHEGADELVLLDITATHEGRGTFLGIVRRVAEVLDIPFTVGGGVGSVNDAHALLDAGADKVSVNSAAVRRPDLINELAGRFGSQCVVLAIDGKSVDGKWLVYLNGGRIPTECEVLEWAREGEQRGAGEILLTSMDHDGTRGGFSLDVTRALSTSLGIPVIASGGAGTMDHFTEVFRDAKADAALAAGIFHTRTIALPDLKAHLIAQGIPTRP